MASRSVNSTHRESEPLWVLSSQLRNVSSDIALVDLLSLNNSSIVKLLYCFSTRYLFEDILYFGDEISPLRNFQLVSKCARDQFNGGMDASVNYLSLSMSGFTSLLYEVFLREWIRRFLFIFQFLLNLLLSLHSLSQSRIITEDSIEAKNLNEQSSITDICS